ncbi:MAG: glycoside hydrolase family 3 protein [Peptostreptococcaceae bacterium]
MKKVNLKAKPFNLCDKDIQWVEDTIKSMTLEEKIGQLFIQLDKIPDKGKSMCDQIQKYHLGGARYTPNVSENLYDQIDRYQQSSKIPLLVACNCDSGGNGACNDGTLIATAAQCGATSDNQTSYDVGYVSGREGAAIGCNWTYGPVADIILNWRNTIVNTRAYGDDVDTVIENAKAYIQGVHQSNMAACAKHFPGDGVEERDQHLVMGVNDLSCEEWDNTFGKAYKELIADGLQSIMVGHIALPEYSRKLRPGIKDTEIMPATLAPELIQDLLREKLEFNGLVLTDATHMIGMKVAKPRKEQIPGAIASGCDMVLFFNNDEDYQYMMDGYKNGTITEERLEDAVRRILGLKASLKLHEMKANNTLTPPREGLKVVGCDEHKDLAVKAAKKSITLVKDTQNNLPINPKTHKNIKVYFVGSQPMQLSDGPDPARQMVKEELEAAGFNVDMHESFLDLELQGSKPQNKYRGMDCGNAEDLKAKYDAVFVFVHMKGYAQENVVRLKWSRGHSDEMPWYVQELPTVCVSLNYTTHLIDLPMMKTYINAYAPTRSVIRETISKIKGDEAFEGKHNETVFCGKWDTRL